MSFPNVCRHRLRRGQKLRTLGGLAAVLAQRRDMTVVVSGHTWAEALTRKPTVNT